jgi:hypothetical protein
LADSLPPDLALGLEARDRNARDVLGHIAGWHQMMLRWNSHALKCVPTAVPAYGYTWDEVTELNLAIWRVIQGTGYRWMRAAIGRTHARALAMLDSLTAEQLWTPGLYEWTRGGTVGGWVGSLTARHYEWGVTKLRRALRLATMDDADSHPGETIRALDGGLVVGT